MLYGYAICSIVEGNQDVDRQRKELKKLGVEESNIYLECESDRNNHVCWELNRLLSTIAEKDTIVTTKVSRLTYSTEQLCKIITFAKDKKLELIIGAFRIDCRKELDPMTEGMLKMIGVVAELEHEIATQNIKSGIANARLKGKRVGRPPITWENLPPLFLQYYHKYVKEEIKIGELARICKITRQTASKYIKICKKAEKERFMYEMFSEYKKEEDRKKNIKKLSDEELICKIQEESDGVWDEDSEYIKEYERRKGCKWGDFQAGSLYMPFPESDENGLLDLSEFDV